MFKRRKETEDKDLVEQNMEEQAPQEKKVRKPLRMGTGWVKATKGVLSVPWMLVKIALGLVGTVLLIVLTTGVIFACSMADYLQDDVMPNSAVEGDPMSAEQSSFIYATDRETGEVILYQKIYAEIDRQWVKYEDIPEDLVNAAIAIEDKRFREHSGVDWFRTVNAMLRMVIGGSADFGGSTITQQFLKNFTQDDDVTVRRKVQEIFRALEYERLHTKDEIMEYYLNYIYLGEGCYGVKSASKVYFGKDVSELTAAECASLISITNNPSLYDPYGSEFTYGGKRQTGAERNRERQLTVLYEMYDQGYLTKAEYEEAKNQEMVFRNTSGMDEYTCPNCGFVGYEDEFVYDTEAELATCPECGHEFHMEIDTGGGYSYFTDAVFEAVASDLADKYGWTIEIARDMIKTGGYHIYSTIDLDAQEKVDEVYTNLANIPDTYSDQQLQSAIVIIDNATGDIVALAGGVGEKTGYLEWSRATRSELQTGSSIKPISVYAPAIELGAVTPATIVKDAPLYDRYPLNESRTWSGTTNVLTGIKQSLNAVSAQVLNLIGVEQSFDFAKNKFGLSTLIEEEETADGRTVSDKAIAPLSMGALTYGAHVSDMASAFATFANGGVWREGRLYTKVYDSQGNLVLDNTQESRQILSQKTNIYMNYLLTEVTTWGASRYANIDGMNVAGKTGTTTEDKDRWFCGYTPYYTAAVWCGYDYPEQIRPVDTSRSPAVTLWRQVMTKLVAGKENRALYDSSGMGWVTMCRDSGDYASDACKKDPRGDRVMSARVFPEDYPSKGYCTDHVLVEYCEEGKAVANEYCSQIKGNTVKEIAQYKYTESELAEYASIGITIKDEVVYDEDDVCKVHTKEMLEEQNKPTEPPTEPTQPSGAPGQ